MLYCCYVIFKQLLNDVGLMVRQAQAVGCLLWEMSMKHLVVAKAEISA